MSDPVGLSIGTTNLVAARVGNPPVIRRSILTLSGQAISGFVERVGDPVPLVTADGTSHSADQLVVEALSALVGDEPSDRLAVAVPAHWTGATLRGLRTAMRAKPNLTAGGSPPRLVSDAVAALTALHANPGLPATGVVALLDFGGGGTSITLADATSSFEPIDTVRVGEFSGDQIDQALMADVLDRVAEADGVDPAGTAAVGSLSLLREECRRAKEALSEVDTVDVRVELPGHSSAVTVTRAQLDALIAARVAGVLAELDTALQRNRIEWPDVTTVALVGGGARIPLIAQRLSAHTTAAVVTTPSPALDAAVGAAVFAAYAADAEAATGVAPTALIPPDVSDAAPGSETFRALAWSQADDGVDDSLLYTDETDYGYDTGTTRAVAQYVPPSGPIDVPDHRPWQRLPQLVFGLAAVIALLAVGGVAVVLTNAVEDPAPSPSSTAPVTATSVPQSVPESVPPSVVEPPPPTPEQQIVTVTETPPPPPEPVYEPPPVTTIITTVETTTPPTTTTTTTTTTTPTTTPTTTTTTTTTTTPPMTTSYITVPFVPVPIPIQVPNSGTTPAPPQYPQQPQYPQYPQQPQFPY